MRSRKGIEDRLELERRSTDDLKELAGCCLLFERNSAAQWFRGLHLLNSRVFSIAITAWSANVWRCDILLLAERLHDRATKQETSNAVSSRTSGYLMSSGSQTGPLVLSPAETRLSQRRGRGHGLPFGRQRSGRDPVTSDGAPGIWRRWQIAVMCGCTEVVTFSQEYPDVVSRTESACHPAMVSSTGCRSNFERLMMASTSLVAVWYSRDSLSSRLSPSTD